MSAGAPLELSRRVPAEAAGMRVDAWLGALEESPTRSQIKQAADDGRLLVDGAPARGSYRLRGGEQVLLRVSEPTAGSEEAQGEDLPLEVLYEDEYLVAINKAPGMVVHPAVGNRAGTLVNALLHRYRDAGLPGPLERAGIVHRLDRDTSGVILVARTVRAHEALARQFRERTLEKLYLAVVRGRVPAAGQIDAPIGRHPTDRKRMSTSARRARTAVTDYEPLERFAAATLLAVRPKTGRTHQIRVHLAARGWPILGDPVYGRACEAPIGRQALHAAAIRFVHPGSGETLRIEAPLAEDMHSLLEYLRRGAVD